MSGPNPGALATTGCIMASSTATCDSEFQSGKRFKEIITNASAPVDLVFDVAAEGVQQGGAGYQVFHRLVNQTQSRLTGFTLELGFGVGENFVQSTGGDGLGFSTVFTSGPDGANAFTQYPFGLFGDAASNPNFTLDGFFSPTRAGFDVALLEDIMFSTGYYGPYKGQFGNWLSSEMTPSGGFYDDDGDPDTDAILMAWLNVDNVWEVRRELDQFDEVVSRAPITFSSLADASTFLGVTLEELSIEDLANLNLNFAIALDAGTVGFNEFTLRVGVQPVPLPASAPILIVALGLVGMMTRRRA